MGRDAYVLRVIGNTRGPVVVRKGDAAPAQAPPTSRAPGEQSAERTRERATAQTREPQQDAAATPLFDLIASNLKHAVGAPDDAQAYRPGVGGERGGDTDNSPWNRPL